MPHEFDPTRQSRADVQRARRNKIAQRCLEAIIASGKGAASAESRPAVAMRNDVATAFMYADLFIEHEKDAK
jgi:hypothetical protein